MGYTNSRSGRVESFLHEQGIGYKPTSGDELILDECPFCGKSGHLYMNRITGAYSCKHGKCMEEGSFTDFQHQIGAILDISGGIAQNQFYQEVSLDTQMYTLNCHKVLMSRPDLVQALCEWWSISPEAVVRAQLGIGQRKNDDRWWLVIPIIAGGVLVNVKYRTWIGYEKDFAREFGGGSALYNIDAVSKMPDDYIIVCMTENTPVNTARGVVKAKDVTMADRLYSHTGQFKPLEKIHVNNYTGTVTKIRTSHSVAELEMTAEHPVLVCDVASCTYPSWKLRCKPNCARRDRYATLMCQRDYPLAWRNAADLRGDEFVVFPINRQETLQTPAGYSLPIEYLTDENFWFLMGLFVGDGTVRRSNKGTPTGVTIYGGTEKKNYNIERLQQFCDKYGKHHGFYRHKARDVWGFSISSVKLGAFFADFYDENKEKCLPTWVETAPLHLQQALVQGYFAADGCLHKNKNGNDIRITSTSLGLLSAMQRIILRFDILVSIEHCKQKPSIAKFGDREYVAKPLYNLRGGCDLAEILNVAITREHKPAFSPHYFIINDCLFVPIKKLERKEVVDSPVYNVTVQQEHTLTTGLITHHNCEGEKDAITLLDMGFSSVVGNSGGAGTFKGEWYQMLERFKMIYLAYDGDVAGDKGMRKQVARFGYERSKKIPIPPEHDINDLRKEGCTKEQFEELLERAQWFELPGVITMSTAFDELHDRIEQGGNIASILTPWPKVNAIFGGGLFDGTLTTLIGPPKTMKTAVITAIAEHNAKRGYPGLLIELEMMPAELAKRDVSRIMHIPFGMIDPLDVTLTKLAQYGMPLYLTRPGRQRLNWRQCLETIRAAWKRYGITFAIIDHVHFLIRNVQDKTAELGIIFQELALLSKELDIPIIALAQPNKSQDDRVRNTYNDVGWTNAAATDSDLIVVLHRFRSDRIPKENKEELTLIQSMLGRELDRDQESFSPIIHMHVDAGRATTGGHAQLWADPNYFSITEISGYMNATPANMNKNDPIKPLDNNGLVLL